MTMTKEDASIINLAPFVPLLEHLANTDAGGLFVEDLPKQMSDINLLSRAWAASLVEFGRHNFIVTGEAPNSDQSFRAITKIIIESAHQNISWTGPRRSAHFQKPLAAILAEKPEELVGLDATVMETAPEKKSVMRTDDGASFEIITEPERRVWAPDAGLKYAKVYVQHADGTLELRRDFSLLRLRTRATSKGFAALASRTLA